jgi:hypothetical protein
MLIYTRIFPSCSLETIVKDIPDFVDFFGEKLLQLIPHDFIAKSQSEFLKVTKDNLKPNEFVVISDFSENYSFVIQDEIQAYHWSNKQCTLHPFSIYFKDANGLQTVSLVVVAESLQHNIVSVHLFQTKLFALEKFHAIAKIYFFSDGSAAQYKNKKNFFNLCQMKHQHGFDAEWHFFATHHGKSPCDALGGTIKRMATKASLHRVYEDHIQTAKDLFEFIQQTDTAIHTVFCSQEQHDEMAKRLEKTYDNVRTITGTQKFHAFIPDRTNSSLNCKRFSSSRESKNVRLVI